MSDHQFVDRQEVSVNADGSIECGINRIEAWPSLRMTSGRDIACVHGIIWATPGDALWPFTERIPTQLLKVAKSIPGYSWQLLELVAAFPERGAVLLTECPALAVLIVRSKVSQKGDPAERYRDLLSLKWRHILSELGLPGSRRVLRILLKVPALHCQPIIIVRLAEAIKTRHPHVRLLSHLPKITSDTISLLRASPEKVNAHLLLASTASGYGQENITWCMDTVSWFYADENPGKPWPYGRLNASELARVQAMFLRRDCDGFEHSNVFPPPPVTGIPGQITALQNVASITTEADEQVNCAVSYIPDIVHGQCYLYSVSFMERATLVLRVNSTGCWTVDELRAQKNQDVSPATESFVHSWLASQAEKRSST